MTNDKPVRKARKMTRGQVLRVQWLTPHMLRMMIGGVGLSSFDASDFTDSYVKILFPVPNVTYPEPFDIEVIRDQMPREQWPRMRSYTVRSWDPHALEMTIDFVYHGDVGVAGPWAAAARPGDAVYFQGPGGAYTPSPEADWHLLVGDESALPAIGAALEALPGGAPAHVFIEVSGPGEEQELTTAGDAKPIWLYREDAPVGAALVAAVRGLKFPPGAVHAFVHGEAGFVKELRRHLRVERGIPLDRLSISGYWRYGTDDEGWRASKAEWKREVEMAEATA